MNTSGDSGQDNVPGRAVRKILGRGGENVKEIQRVSRCKVDIDRGAVIF